MTKTIATTKLSSKGQIVIPEDIRLQLNLKSGDQFVAVADKDSVMLKRISPPSNDEFISLLKKAKTEAKKAKLTKKELTTIIDSVRKHR